MTRLLILEEASNINFGQFFQNFAKSISTDKHRSFLSNYSFRMQTLFLCNLRYYQSNSSYYWQKINKSSSTKGTFIMLKLIIEPMEAEIALCGEFLLASVYYIGKLLNGRHARRTDSVRSIVYRGGSH